MFEDYYLASPETLIVMAQEYFNKRAAGLESEFVVESWMKSGDNIRFRLQSRPSGDDNAND